MKLKSTSLFAKIYIWFYKELPQNLCPLFWNTLLTVLLFPLVIINRLLDMTAIFQTDSDFWKKTALARAMAALWYLVWFHCTLFAFVIMADFLVGMDVEISELDYLAFVGIGLIMWLIVSLMLGAIGLIVYLIVSAVREREEAKYKRFEELSDEQKAEYYDYKEKKKEPSKFRILWDTFLNKYCTKIDWE